MKIVLAFQDKRQPNKSLSRFIWWQLKTPTRTWKCTRCNMQMSSLIHIRLAFQKFLQTRQTSRSNKKLCKKGFWLWWNIGKESQKLTRYQSEEFSYSTNAKVYAYNKREQMLFIQIAKLKKFSTLTNSPFPLTQSIKVHRRALVLLPCLHCENSQLSPVLIMQRDNIHARTHDTCVD